MKYLSAAESIFDSIFGNMLEYFFCGICALPYDFFCVLYLLIFIGSFLLLHGGILAAVMLLVNKIRRTVGNK